MFDKLKEVFGQYNILSPKDMCQIIAIAKLSIVKKDELIIREGELNYQAILVVKGLLRHYIIDSNGVDKTLFFVTEKQSTASIDTIFHDKPSSNNIIALENSVIIKFDNRAADKLANDNFRLVKLQNQAFKKIISTCVEQMKILSLYTPEERYSYFCKHYPELEQRIKQKYLASYLGITPTSLSRLRARIVQN